MIYAVLDKDGDVTYYRMERITPWFKMLSLIGLGLWDEKDITLRGLEIAKESDVVYLEKYTSKLIGSTKEKLEKLIGKKIQYANRDYLESGEILATAAKNKVALLVAGDPMVATTHSQLILDAKEKGIKTQVIHNASIYSGVAETGLQIYKFGRSATITFWEGDYKPSSWFDIYKENKEKGLHTLFFLDLNLEQGKLMSAQDGLNKLLEVGLKKDTLCVVVSQLGNPKRIITAGTVQDLLQKNLGIPLQVIIIPGKLHDAEKEYLEKLKWIQKKSTIIVWKLLKIALTS